VLPQASLPTKPAPTEDILPLVDAAHTVKISRRLTYWTAPHPRWLPNPEWPREVGCVLFDAGDDALVLVDPLIRGDLDRSAWEWLDGAVAAVGKPVAVLLTAPWHERSTRAALERYDARVWAAPPARRRVSDLPQRDTVPKGILVFTPRGVDEGQVAFFLEGEQTLIVADFFLGTDGGLRVAPSPATHDLREFAESLDELERLEIERVLVSHGPPVLRGGNDAISAALGSFRRTNGPSRKPYASRMKP
jgi:glyoxylase-like metal-dependent hydrolase (beta-lactamase superfamily II)